MKAFHLLGAAPLYTNSFVLISEAGHAVVIDPAAAPECLSCILSDVEVRPATLMEKLCPGGTVFTARSSRRVKHVFSELYAVPEDIRKGYLKVKLLELLLFLSTLSPEDGQTPHGCTAAQVTLAEQVKACLLAESDRTLTLKSLSQQFNVSEAQIKSSFARVYGMSPAAYARSQRMHGAAALLRENGITVYGESEIGRLLEEHGQPMEAMF